ncbi:hypothetical protein [Azotobacter chroococcum]|uniref:hypothetical protein n=1 Tax=Azotobacter chroococcum TaxID=353 RepID=UPI0005855166|nr:hypothetical protein [Azotobacter chroococcum]
MLDFVKEQSPPPQTTADDINNINFNERVEGPSAGFTIVQTGSNADNRVDARIIAYDSTELGNAYHDGTIGDDLLTTKIQTIVAIEVGTGIPWSAPGHAVAAFQAIPILMMVSLTQSIQTMMTS